MWWREYWWLILVAILLIPVVVVAVFARVMKKQQVMKIDERVKCWEVFIKLISAYTVIVSGAMIFGKYVDQRDQIETAQINLRREEYLRDQLRLETVHFQQKKKLFDEVKQLAVTLSEKPDDSNARRRFREMYSAALIGVEKVNGDVEKAMVRFRSTLEYKSGDIRQLALQLSKACDDELTAEPTNAEQRRKPFEELKKLADNLAADFGNEPLFRQFTELADGPLNSVKNSKGSVHISLERFRAELNAKRGILPN